MFLFPRIYVGFWLLTGGVLGVASWLGLTWQEAPIRLMGHMLLGLFAAFTALLLHTAVMMHSVGTGRALKMAAPYLEGGDAFVARQLRFKNLTYPVAVLGCLSVVATAILGGATNFGLASSATHRGLVIAAAAIHAIALPWELYAVRGSAVVNAEVEEALRAKVEDLRSRGLLPPEGLPMPWQEGG